MNKVLFFVLTAFQMQAQDTIVFPKVDTFKRNIIEVGYGVPLGKLADKYESSITTGLYFRNKITKRQFIDVGIEIGGIRKGRDVAYKVNGEAITIAGSKSSFLLGFRYSRFLYQSRNENFHIESNSGIAWKYLHYSKPEEEEYNEIDFRPQLNTIAVSQGIKIMYYGFGVHCNYHYSPYGLFNPNAERNFGGSSINYGISGSWNF